MGIMILAFTVTASVFQLDFNSPDDRDVSEDRLELVMQIMKEIESNDVLKKNAYDMDALSNDFYSMLDNIRLYEEFIQDLEEI